MSDELIMTLIAVILSICATMALFMSNIKKSDGWRLVFIVLEMFAIFTAIFALVHQHLVLVAVAC